MRRPAAKTLAGVLAEHAKATPRAPALLRDDVTVSYAELLTQASQAGKALLAAFGDAE